MCLPLWLSSCCLHGNKRDDSEADTAIRRIEVMDAEHKNGEHKKQLLIINNFRSLKSLQLFLVNKKINERSK